MAHRLPLADIQFIAEFATFCRSKGDERYDFLSNENCAMAQFLRASGRCANPRVRGFGKWYDADDAAVRIQQAPVCPEGERCDVMVLCHQRTFSALADRLEALIATSPVVVKS